MTQAELLHELERLLVEANHVRDGLREIGVALAALKGELAVGAAESSTLAAPSV